MSPSTDPTCPATRPGSATSPRTDRSAGATQTRTPPGATAPQSPSGRVAGSPATRSTWPSARTSDFRSHGMSVPPGTLTTANFALPLIDKARERGFGVLTATMDKGYDVGPVYEGCEARNCRPVIPLPKTPAVVRGDHKPADVRARDVARSPEPIAGAALDGRRDARSRAAVWHDHWLQRSREARRSGRAGTHPSPA